MGVWLFLSRGSALTLKIDSALDVDGTCPSRGGAYVCTYRAALQAAIDYPHDDPITIYMMPVAFNITYKALPHLWVRFGKKKKSIAIVGATEGGRTILDGRWACAAAPCRAAWTARAAPMRIHSAAHATRSALAHAVLSSVRARARGRMGAPLSFAPPAPLQRTIPAAEDEHRHRSERVQHHVHARRRQRPRPQWRRAEQRRHDAHRGLRLP